MARVQEARLDAGANAFEPPRHGGDWAGAWFQADATPRMVFAADLRVVEANEAARALLRRRTAGLAVRDGGLTGPDALVQGLRARLKRHDAGPGHVFAAPLLARLRLLSSPSGQAVAASFRDVSAPLSPDGAALEAAFGLTRAEHRTLLLLIQGLNAVEVAERLNKSVLTVRTHLKHLNAKLAVRNREQMFAKVLPHLIMD